MIRHASAGEELLSYPGRCAEDDLPTVILLDYQMPGLNGREVLKALQTDTRYKPIVKVMWSTSQRVKDMEDCKKPGASDYLRRAVICGFSFPLRLPWFGSSNAGLAAGSKPSKRRLK